MDIIPRHGQQSHLQHIITAWHSSIFPIGRYHKKSIYLFIKYVFLLTAWMMVMYSLIEQSQMARLVNT